jgi:predicted enzyme related to lactoylglutathione lyase
MEEQMIELRPRESVILAENYEALVEWYKVVLGFRDTLSVADDYNYAVLENENGIRIGIASAEQMGVAPADRTKNTVLLQVEVPDVKEFFEHLAEHEGGASFGPSYDKKGNFWYGGFHDLEGNPFWVVDENTP